MHGHRWHNILEMWVPRAMPSALMRPFLGGFLTEGAVQSCLVVASDQAE